MKQNYLLGLLLVLWGNFMLQGQTINVTSDDMPNPNLVVACGDPETFKVNINGPAPVGTVVTTILPAGVTFNSLVGNNVTATPTANGVNFTLTSPLTTTSDKVTITYKVNIACSGIETGSEIIYRMAGIADYLRALPPVQYSLLEVTSVSPDNATINVHGTQNYTFKVKQSADTYSNNVKVYINHSTKVSLTTSIGTLTLGTPTNGSQTDILELTGANIALFGNHNTRFEKDEEVTGVITAKLLECTDGETITFKAGYGCGTTNACETGNTTSVGLAANIVGDPALTMTQTKKPWPGYLSTDYDYATYVLKNTGTGTAYNVKVQLGFAYNGYEATHRDYMDFYDFTVNGNAMTETVDDRADFDFATNPNGPGDGLSDQDGIGGFNDLAPGQQVTIRVKLRQTLTTMNQVCRASYFNSAGTSAVDAIRWRLISYTACGTDKSFNEVNDNKGTNTPFTVGIIAQTSDISATGGNINFNATTNNSFSAVYNFGSNGTSLSAATGYTVNGTNAFYRVKVVLPAGVIPNPGSLATYSDTSKFTITANTALTNLATRTYYYDLKPVAIGAANMTIAGRVSIPLIVDPNCNSNGVFNVKFSVALFRDATNVFIPEMGCSTSPNFTLGCGMAPGLGIDSFDLKRQTFGYKDVAGTQIATESDIPAAELNNYLNGDKMVAAYKLSLNDKTIKAAELNLEYDKYDWLYKNVGNAGIKSITGTYTTSSETKTFTISGADLDIYYTYLNDVVGADGTHKSRFTFHIMELFQPGRALSTATLVDGAKLDFNVNFLVNQDLQTSNANSSTDTAQGYVVKGISTYPEITFNDNSTAISNYKSDKATTFAYSVVNSISANSPIDLIQCTDGSYETAFQFSRNSVVGDLFPTEYRYNSKIDQLILLVPKGVTYKAGSTTFKLSGSTAVAINDPVVTYGFDSNGATNPGGLYDKYTFTNDGTWPRMDATKSFDIENINFKFTTNNLYRNYQTSSPDSFKVYYLGATGQYSLNFDQPRSITVPTAPYGSHINYKLINYTVSSAAANPTTATNVVTWPLTITNQSTTTMPNFWIAVETTTNNSVVPTLWDGTTQIPMVSYGTGKYWAQVGSIASGAKTFELRSNNFTICGTGGFTVKTSFECAGYPTNPEKGFANQGNRTLWTQDYAMTLSTQNPALTATSSVNISGNQTFGICTPIDESLTITNGANGYAYRITPNITLPTGMTFIPNSFKVNYNGVDYNISDPTLVTGQTYSVNIYTNNSIPFATSGLPGTSNATASKTFVLKYQVAMVCYTGGVGNYISGSKIHYKIPYESGCQAAMTALDFDTQAIEFGGGVQGKSYVNTLKTIEPASTNGNHHMSVGKEMQITIVNQGNSVNSLETVKVFVDPAYDYEKNSYVLQSGNTFASMPPINEPTSQIDATGVRQIVWTLPNGFSSNAGQNTIQFNFKLKVVKPENLTCTSTTEVSMNTYIGTTLTCAINNQSCSLEYPTGATQKQTIHGFNPSITATSTSSSFNTASGTTTYLVGYNIHNSDAVYDVKQGLKLELYYDANNNGTVDIGETLLDTKYTDAAIAPTQNLIGTMSGQFTGAYQNFVLIIK